MKTEKNKKSTRMHSHDIDSLNLMDKILHYARDRIAYDQPLDSPLRYEELKQRVGKTITKKGIGGDKALKIFTETLAPSCLSSDHPGYLSFIPNASTEAATMFDLVVSASSIYGGSWSEGAGAVYAENEVLKWLVKEFNMPSTANGTFVSGGTIGNLSALVTARESYKQNNNILEENKKRLGIICSEEAHSSLTNIAKVMDIEIIKVPVNDKKQLSGNNLSSYLSIANNNNINVFAIVATAGTTNLGVVDDIESVAEFCLEHNIWLHIDGAYGLAACIVDEYKHMYKGLEHADSVIVDPHKWLFTPYDSCALIYKNPNIAKKVHTQNAEYLDVLNTNNYEYNPSDYAIHLTRRARGLPLWFSLACYGTESYKKAIKSSITNAREIAKEISQIKHLDLIVEPQLSIVAFKHKYWSKQNYYSWSEMLLKSGIAFVTPSSYRGETIIRYAIINPRSDIKLLRKITNTINYAS